MEKIRQELKMLIQEHPSLSAGEILRKLNGRGWQIERGNEKMQPLLESTPGWVLLLNQTFNSKQPIAKETHRQLIATGQYKQVADVLSGAAIRRIKELSNSVLKDNGHPPVSINRLSSADQISMEKVLISVSKTVLDACERDTKYTKKGMFTLLMNRCILRRTYSPDEWSEDYKNGNNQHWHQDSNAAFNSRPMLTIWVPLDHGAGTTRPGLEISDIAIDGFSTQFGDSTEILDEVMMSYGVDGGQCTVPSVPLGSCLAFNGMTFHRTYMSDGMNGERDVLLIRLCKTSDAMFFPGERAYDLSI